MSDDLVAPAVAEAVSKLDTKPEDVALVRLVERYAAAIDAAARIALAAEEIEPENADQARALSALRDRVDAVTVLADLGPKLAAALEMLGASPKARAGFARKGGDSGDGKPSKLAQLRALRAGQSGAATVDPAAS